MTETERLRARLLGFRPTDRLAGWIYPLIVAIFGGVVRFVELGRPNTIIFDETYYVKQAYSLLMFGYERKVKGELTAEGATPNADAVWATGNRDIFVPEPDFVVHPPVGKWVLASGQWLFGTENPFGWRFAAAVLGTLSILMIARVGRRLFGSTLLGTIAGLLLAVEGHHFVHSRTGLLDIVVMFFAFAAFVALVVDRDTSRERLAVTLGALREAGVRDRRTVYGPWLGIRPWRIVAAVSLGLCIGTKWSGLYFTAIFGLMTVLWDMGARRAAGLPRWVVGGLSSGVQAALTMLPIAVSVYVASWVGWFRTSGGWDRQWATTHPASGIAAMIPDPIRGLWFYHEEMWRFHLGLTVHHDYQSNPWGWIVMARPTSFYYEGPKQGEQGCTVESCSKAITNIGTISIWWACAATLALVIFMWALRRDWRAGAILSGFVGGYLPWFLYQDRTIYTFYAVAFVPWVVLAVTYVLGLILGPPDASPERRRRGVIIVGTYVVLTVVCFAFWWPVLTAQVIPYDQWTWRMWFPSWI